MRSTGTEALETGVRSARETGLRSARETGARTAREPGARSARDAPLHGEPLHGEPPARPRQPPLSPEEAELAARLSKALASPVQRLPRKPASPVHVSIASQPEDAIPVPEAVPFDALLPPPLPIADPGSDVEGAAEAGVTTSRVAAPWLQQKRRRPSAVLSWLLTLAIIAGVLSGAAVVLLGYERVAAAVAEAIGLARGAVDLLNALLTA